MHFNTIDYIVLFGYIVLVITIGLWVSRRDKKVERKASDYFLANKGLTWWVIGASLIASNISAEQFIGMSGSGFKIGMGIASYEWMAALTLLIVAVFFMPVFLRQGIYTMPQFLEQRYDKRVKTVMAIFWVLTFIFVNLTSVLYLGALAIKNVSGGELLTVMNFRIDPLVLGIILLGSFTAVYSVYGGFKAVAYTDVIQVTFLVCGGLLTTYLALKALGGTAFEGFVQITKEAPEKFHMILDKNNPDYIDLPGIGVLIGGMWVANLYYWGCNQYIIQRALAAKSIKEAQKGLVFAGFIKILLPLIVVIPGIVAFVLKAPISKPDEAYPWLLQNFIPSGVKGLCFAALVAAIAGSLAAMMNSISTIFTMDIYKAILNKGASEHNQVYVGRAASVVAIIIAMIVAPMLRNLDQAFQYIQEFTGFVSPGALAIFLMGMFWKRATANGALTAAGATFVLSFLFKFLCPALPFMDRMGIVFLLCMLLIVVVSYFEGFKVSEKAIKTDKALFATSKGFKILAIIIIIILAFLYAYFW
ncbi:MAG: solute:sodium symporter family transporter [Bacteroidota bacterium]